MADETPPPLDDARLAEIRESVDNINERGRYSGAVSSGEVIYAHDVSALLAKVERLRAELADARMNAAAEIHQEGHRLIAHDRGATLHQLLTYIERRYGRDNLAASWKDE